jgi:hypothetical protein
VAEIHRSVKYHVNMGNFEWIEIEAGITVPVSGGDQPDLVDFSTAGDRAQKILEDLVLTDLDEATRNTRAEGEGSFIERWRTE